MKRSLLLCFFLLCSLLAVGQVDIRIGQIGPIRTFAQNVPWALSGQGGFNNNYIFSPTPGYSGACVYIQNLDTGSAHGFIFGVLGSGDQSQTSYLQNPAAWNGNVQVNLPPNGFTQVFAGASTNAHIRTTGQARLVLLMSNGSGAGNVSIFVIEDDGQVPCAGQQSNVQPSSGAINPTLIQCTSSVTQTIAVGTTGVLVNSIGSSRTVHVCAYVISVDAVITTPGSLLFLSGTGAGCTTGTATKWGEFLPAALGSRASLGSGSGDLFSTSVDQLCLQNNGVTAGSVRVSVSYAVL